MKIMKNMLKKYYRHMKHNKKTLISKVFGLFTISFSFIKEDNTTHKSQRFNIFVMENLAKCDSDYFKKNCYAVYDIKGSEYGR